MKTVYWMNPLVIMSAWACIGAFSLLMSPEMYYLLMRTTKTIEPIHLGIALAGIGIFSLGAVLGMFSVSGQKQARNLVIEDLTFILQSVRFRRACLIYAVLMMVAYAIWLGPTLNPSVIMAFFTGKGFVGRDVGNQIGGITTMTQFGVALAVVSGYGIALSTKRNCQTFYSRLLFLILFLALYRSFIWSERLALVECAIPAVTAWTIAKNTGQASFRIAPVLAAAAVVFFFGTTEYFRSWNFYSQFDINIAYFSASRFLSYYVSSFNNLAVSIEYFEPSGLPLNSMNFLFKLPLPGFETLNQIQAELWEHTFMGGLERFGNPEFNLFTGVGMMISDFGIFWGVVLLLIPGFISGRLYRLVQFGRLSGLFIFPVWMIGLLEFGRLLYWGTSRTLFIWVLIFVLLSIAGSLIRASARARFNPSMSQT
ncbi:hypothetical protein [Ruegeria arenilitoris]|uniref:hypothetical protein n=1 Tax=Ruegeria arenilitoris TaxID=1173585 RepID=UPI001C2C7966|nr:hypothetical protein [Ruegeria arenilitoris]